MSFIMEDFVEVFSKWKAFIMVILYGQTYDLPLHQKLESN